MQERGMSAVFAICGFDHFAQSQPVLFEEMLLWIDPVRRSGPETMAVDEWLLETASCPVLRVYGWEGDWGSVGYFGKIAEARGLLPGLQWVRRWTGGGIVDHRKDWTYTLVCPAGLEFSRLRGAESYRLIHEKLSQTIALEQIESKLSSADSANGAALCFENPVGHDLVGLDRRKLAGAGQRRSKWGVLHQGSVAISPVGGIGRAENFATHLAGKWRDFGREPEPDDLQRRQESRYALEVWLDRR